MVDELPRGLNLVTEGVVHLDGHRMALVQSIHTTGAAQHMGVETVHQHGHLVPRHLLMVLKMTHSLLALRHPVMEVVMLGAQRLLPTNNRNLMITGPTSLLQTTTGVLTMLQHLVLTYLLPLQPR